jgi:hypothetical protein
MQQHTQNKHACTHVRTRRTRTHARTRTASHMHARAHACTARTRAHTRTRTHTYERISAHGSCRPGPPIKWLSEPGLALPGRPVQAAAQMQRKGRREGGPNDAIRLGRGSQDSDGEAAAGPAERGGAAESLYPVGHGPAAFNR